jgi:hypothetical protein
VITIDELRVGDTSDAWRAIGFQVVHDICAVGGVRICLGGEGSGITGWTLRGIPADTVSIDGLVSRPAPPAPQQPHTLNQHPNGVTRIDHVVLMTPDVVRTFLALETLGLDVRRERDAGAFRQLFFRLGPEILELVGPHEAGPGPASLWGITFVVGDIDATAEFLGERVGRVKDAVQPGRRITTLRGREIGISPAIAFMTERAG